MLSIICIWFDSNWISRTWFMIKILHVGHATFFMKFQHNLFSGLWELMNLIFGLDWTSAIKWITLERFFFDNGGWTSMMLDLGNYIWLKSMYKHVTSINLNVENYMMNLIWRLNTLHLLSLGRKNSLFINSLRLNIFS